jgi:hypothetical protein
MDALIRKIKLILLITNLHSKGLERKIGDVDEKKKTLFDFFNTILALQMKVCHSIISKYSYIPFWLYLKITFKVCSIELNHSLQYLLVKSLNIHIPLSLFNISKHSFC